MFRFLVILFVIKLYARTDIFFLWWYWFCEGQSAYQPNEPYHWSVVLRDYVRTVHRDLLLLCQLVSFDCVFAFDACKTWHNNNIFVAKPFQKLCPSIVVRPRVERITTGHSNHINGHSPRWFERKVAIDRIPMVLSSDRKGNVENQLPINSWKFW